MTSILPRLMISHVSKNSLMKSIGEKYVRSIFTCKQKSSIGNPDYLDSLKPKIPPIPLIDIQMKGYDFAVLENFHSRVHSVAEMLDLEVETGWAVRAQSIKVTKIKPDSKKVEEEIPLKMYERVLQLENVPSTSVGVLIEALQATTPPGVTCTVMEHTAEMDDNRYVPDAALKELQAQLAEMKENKTK